MPVELNIPYRPPANDADLSYVENLKKIEQDEAMKGFMTRNIPQEQPQADGEVAAVAPTDTPPSELPSSGADTVASEAPDGNLLTKAGDVAADVGEGIIELPRQTIGGMFDASKEALKTFQDLDNWLNENVIDTRLPVVGIPLVDDLFLTTAEAIPEIDEARTTTGGIIRGVSQFLTGFKGVDKVLKMPAAAGKLGIFAQASLKGAVADMTVFDPAEDNLANLIEQFPELQNPVTEFLSADPNDGQASNRLKKALEGLMLGGVTEGFTMGLKTLRRVRIARKAQKAEVEIKHTVEGDAVIEEIAEGRRMKLEDQMGGAPDGPRYTVDDSGEVMINFNRINSPEDVKEIMQMLANKSKSEIDQARRGKQTFQEIELNAAQIDAWDTLNARRHGQPLNAEETLAARQLWATTSMEVRNSADEYLRYRTPEAMYKLHKMLAVHQTVQTEVLAARTETARALAQWRIPVGMGLEFDKNIEALIDMRNPRVTKDIAERVVGLSEAGLERELDHFVRGSVWARTADAVRQLWINALLSGPFTHVKNFTSNTAVLFQQLAERRIAETYARAFGNSIDDVVQGETLQMTYGMVEGLRDAFIIRSKALRAMKAFADRAAHGDFKGSKAKFLDEIDEGDVGSFYASVATGESRMGRSKVEDVRAGSLSGEALSPTPGSMVDRTAQSLGIGRDSPVGRSLGYLMDGVDLTTRVPGSALNASDSVFKTINYRMAARALSLRQATKEINQGLLPADGLTKRMQELMSNEDWLRKAGAEHQAAYNTFTNEAADVPMAVVRGLGNIPVLGRILLPFRRTPINLTTYAFERTPLAPLVKTWRDDILRGGADAQIASARISLGTGVLLLMADLSMSGMITGGGSIDSGRRSLARRKGELDYAIKIEGDDGEIRSFSYKGLEPIATPLGLAADLVQILEDMNPDDYNDVEVEQVVAATAIAIASQLGTKSYLQGVSSFFESMSDPKRYGETYIKRLTASIVPSIVGHVARQEDPYVRAAYDIQDTLRAKIPGMSQGLPYQRDLWGRKINRQSGLGDWYDALIPAKSKQYKAESIDLELERLEYYPTKPSRRINFEGIDTAIDLRRYPEAYDRYLELAGNKMTTDIKGIPIDIHTRKGLKGTLNDLVRGRHPVSELYDMRTDHGKVEVIKSTIRKFQTAAKMHLLEEFPGLREEYTEKRMKAARTYEFEPKPSKETILPNIRF